MNLPRAPVNLAYEADFALGGVRIRPALRQLRKDDITKVVEPRVMQVLVALARRGGEVVDRDELVRLCWAGLFVGDDAIQRAVAKVRRLGEASGAFTVETIPRVGYRLVAADLPTAVPEAAQVAQALARLPSIGVLPFLNLTGEANKDYFVDGITEEIITALSRFREMRTAPRGSTFAYKGKTLELPDIAPRLGVDYILTGSIRMAGRRIRVSAELAHCESRAQVWHKSFDREVTSIFELQDELSRSVAAIMLPVLRHAEVERASRKAAQDLTAYDLYLRALPHMWGGKKDGVGQAINLLRQSLERDTNATTLGALAFSFMVAFPLGAISPTEALPEALRYARMAIELDADDAFAHAIYGLGLAMSSSDREQVLLHAQEAVRLNPGSAFAWGGLGVARILLGDFEHGIETLGLAIRLSPSDDIAYMWLTFLAAANFALERYDDSAAAARQAALRNPNYGTAHRLLAASLARTRRIAEARAITQARDLVQKTTLKELRAAGLFQQAPVMERYLEAQRLCGVND
jgi:TolB-like protein/cytochrome c-type biogenesis protein CcmH/NrfG